MLFYFATLFMHGCEHGSEHARALKFKMATNKRKSVGRKDDAQAGRFFKKIVLLSFLFIQSALLGTTTGFLLSGCARYGSDVMASGEEISDIQNSDEPLVELERFHGFELGFQKISDWSSHYDFFRLYRGMGEWLWDSDFSKALLDVRVLPGREPAQAKKRKAAKRSGRIIRSFRFAVISDTHNAFKCGLGQGSVLRKAIDEINKLELDFVVALGDLVAGGGDCLEHPGAKKGSDEEKSFSASLEEQLHELYTELVVRLEVPLIVVEGNHDLDASSSQNKDYARDVWEEFWQSNRNTLLKQVRRSRYRRSYRFRHKGVGFAVLGYYNSLGLEKEELKWVKNNVRGGDIVFRHVNLYGIACCMKGYCGFAIRDDGIREYEKLHDVLKKRKIKAIFSGHTHAFYHGICDGVQFINTGSLGDRSLEFVKGWEESPFRERHAYVVVEVLPDTSLNVRFRIFDTGENRFVDFDPKEFPPEVRVHRVRRFGYEEGIDGVCESVRGEE